MGITAKKYIIPHGLKRIDENKIAETAPEAPIEWK
jgi:hypothetical protein